MRGIERQWHRRNFLTCLLYPFAVLFGVVIRLRRALYATGILRTRRLAVPVVVIGNISVGGTGKTPLIIWLCRWLRDQGMRPGIIARGYGGDGTLRTVTPNSTAGEVGDEPLLLARRCQVPVVVAPRRVEAGAALLRDHPDCDVILSDDGLQHLALARDVEVAVIDGKRGFGNGLLLPAGPLREPTTRLASVDAVVVNGGNAHAGLPAFDMALAGERFLSLAGNADRKDAASPRQWRGVTAHAIAGIGDPERFFRHLESLGLRIERHPFPDHHRFTPADLAFAGDDIVLMTEKDAVKCAAFAQPNWWYLPVDAVADAALGTLILAKIRHRHGS